MRTHNETGLAHGYVLTSRQPPQLEMSVAVRGVFRLAPGEPLTIVDDPLEAGPITGDMVIPGSGELYYPSDVAPFKPVADLLLGGACHTPGGLPAPVCTATFGVGEWSKSVAAIGERNWSATGMTEPQPFTQMPLLWANAFGGPGYAANPVGRGFESGNLPTVEDPARLVRSPGDRPAPAGFGPISAEWQARRSLVGSRWGDDYQQHRAPWFAEDLDWRYFNAAPADQQLPGYLRGDEALLFRNLHAGHETVTTQLPALRVRAFVIASAGFGEVALNLDTLFADLWRGRIHLVWRGLTPIEDDEFRDVRALVIGAEPMAEAPLPEDHYRAIAEQLANPAPLPEPPVPEPIDASQISEPESVMELAPATADDATAAAFKDMTRVLPPDLQAEIGTSLNDAAMELANAPAAAGGAAAGALGASMAQGLALPGAPTMPALPTPPGAPAPPQLPPLPDVPAPAALQAQLEKAAAQLPEQAVDPAQMEQFRAALDSPELEEAFQTVEEVEAPPEVGEVEDAVGNTYRDFSDHDLSDRDLRAEDYSGCKLANTRFENSELTGVSFVGADCAGAVFFRAALDGCDFTGADLTRAVFDEASLQGANLTACTMTATSVCRAACVGAVLEHAEADGSLYAGTDLTGAVLCDGSFATAVFDDAVLVAADLTRAVIDRASLRGVDARDATFVETTAHGICAGGGLRPASFVNADFTAVYADGSVWSDSDLTGASFIEAELAGCLFTGATLDGADFSRARLVQSAMRRVHLDGASFHQCNLMTVDFTRSLGAAPEFTQCNAFDMTLRNTAFDTPDFSGTDLSVAIGATGYHQ